MLITKTSSIKQIGCHYGDVLGDDDFSSGVQFFISSIVYATTFPQSISLDSDGQGRICRYCKTNRIWVLFDPEINIYVQKLDS